MKQVLELEKVRAPLHQYDSRPLNVLQVGPSLDQKGGMASVEILIVKEAANAHSRAENEGRGSAPAVVTHLCTHDEGSVLHRVSVFASSLFKYVRLLSTDCPDLIHMHVAERGSVWRKLLLLMIAKPFNTKVIFHTHGCQFHDFHENLPAVLRTVVNRLLQQADGYIMLSQSWKDYYVKACGLEAAEVIVLPNPAEMPDTVPNRVGAATVRFAFLGRIGQRKGAFDLIRAFASMPTELRERGELLMAGDGDEEGARALSAELGVAERVKFLGWINPAERNQLLQRANAFVLPSYNEGLPMAMLEAMAWALPTISTPVGGIPEFLDDGETGYLVEPGDVEKLAYSMERLIGDEGLRLRLGEQARVRVKPLDIKLYYDQLIEIYRSVVYG
ncbi:MAG: glycosyltransferase family 4 protein [Cyanobacteria bacterium P01_D01_bin.36]